MDIALAAKAVALGIVEGLTEFLPVSSTGHLILAAEALRFTGEKAKLFEIVIQLGAILAVVWAYRRKVWSVITQLSSSREARSLGANLLVAFVPAALVGALAHDYIKQYLFSPGTVAMALVVGGFAILKIEHMEHPNTVEDADSIPFRVALWVGLAQVLSLFPGVSRAGATIMGGLLAGMTRKAATEFSFFLAIPVMFAATAFDLGKSYGSLAAEDIAILGIGFISAFLSALWVVRWLLQFVSTNDFKPFAYYRIVFGCLLLILFWRAG